MMRALLRCAAIAACAIILAGSAGCGSSTTRFYTLNPLPPGSGQKEANLERRPAVGVGPVFLPDRLDRPQIVTRTGENTLHLAEFDQWASPIRDSFPRVLAENLSILVPTDRVTIFPWTSEDQIDYEVRVEVSRFEGSLGGECSLRARWSLLKRANKQIMPGSSDHSEPAGATYTTLVAAENRLLVALSRDIAAALRAFK